MSAFDEEFGPQMKWTSAPARFEAAARLVASEYADAIVNNGPMCSAHEGMAVLREEFDELWDEVKRKERTVDRMRQEAIQVAAMAIRFLVDVCDVGKEKP